MNCIYRLGNLRFNSELELDDFILSDGHIVVSMIGDVAYQQITDRQQNRVLTIKKVRDAGRQAKKAAKIKDIDSFNHMFEERIGDNDKFTAITKFLQGLTTVDNELMFPQMIKDNFFKERRKDWQVGIYTDRELDSLKDAMSLQVDAQGHIQPPEVFDDEVFAKIRETFEKKWETEAKIGSAIHRICQTFFHTFDKNEDGYDKDNTIRIKGDVITDNAKLQKMLKNFEKFNDAGDKISDFLTEEQQIQVIQFCRNLKESIEKTWSAHNAANSQTPFLYYPELSITADALHPVSGKDTKLIGVIDLLVIDPNGTPHIVDYKVSPADFQKQSSKEKKVTDPDDYSAAKVLAFDYQLSTYSRMLRTYSPSFHDTTIAVAPIQLLNLSYKNNKWTFENIELNKPPLEELLTSDQIHLKNKIEKNLDQVFVDAPITDVDNQRIIANTAQIMSNFFKDKKIGKYTYTEEDVAEMYGKSIQENKEGKVITYSATLNGKIYEASTKESIIKSLKDALNQGATSAKSLAEDFKGHIKGTKSVYRSSIIENAGGSTEWYEKIVQRYPSKVVDNPNSATISADSIYEIISVPDELDYLGIVPLRNKLTGNIEIIKLTRKQLKKQKFLGKNKKLTGAYMDDIEDESKQDYVLESVQGNIEIMETLAAINQLPSLFNKAKITTIQVVNPYINSGLTATNKQILYTYKMLTKFSPIPETICQDNIGSGKIQFCNLAEQALDILYTGLYLSSVEKNQLFSSCLPEKDAFYAMNKDKQKEALENILDVMESGEGRQNSLRQIKKYAKIEAMPADFRINDINFWYHAVLRGYAELAGQDFRQQVREYGRLVDIDENSKSWWATLERGHSGLELDNPGTTANKNANLVSEDIENTYNRVTNRLKPATAKIQKLVQALKDEFGKSWLKERFSFDPLSIYKGITKTVTITDGETGETWEDWVFENPKNLTGSQKDFAEHMLLLINYNRFGQGKTLEKYKQDLNDALAKKDVPIRLLRVPLGFVGTKGVLETNGLIQGLKDYIKSWKFDEVKRRFKEEFGHMYDTQGQEMVQEIFRMGLIFDRGETTSSRKEMLSEIIENKDGSITRESRINQFDHDLERLLLKHLYAYYLKEEFDEASYLIKASLIDQRLSEATQNDSRENSVDYITKLTKRMTGKRIMSQKEELINMYVKKFMSGASVMALGFSPKQVYQALEGIYKDIGLLIRKPDGSYGFTFSEMLASFADVWKQIGHFGNKRSKLERINELFRLNDMDMNVYAQHLQDRHNVWHDLSTFLFRFASRPDFYNRLTIIESYMRHDGVWDTYELNENNELIYHFDKDPRFEALRSGNTKSKEYNEQLGLYRAMAEQFVKEGAYNADGTKFEIGKTDGKWNPLPQAYTNKEINSYKALTDQMYGYYSHEKKALIQSSLVGAMFFQMYTYFSGKKNQWLAPGSVKNQGRMQHYEELVTKEITDPQTGEKKYVQETEKFYYQVDSNGEVQYDLPPVSESQLTGDIKVPYIQWKGTFSQGVLITLSRMLGDIMRSDFKQQSIGQAIKKVTNDYWNNEDENLQIAYRQNLRQFAYETAVFFLVGGLIGSQIHRAINTYTNDHKDDHTVVQGFKNSSLALFDAIFKSSTLDFNVLESLGGRGISWTPFSIDMWKRTVQNWSTAITGDRTFADAALRTFSATKYTLVPFLKTIKDVETAE